MLESFNVDVVSGSIVMAVSAGVTDSSVVASLSLHPVRIANENETMAAEPRRNIFLIVGAFIFTNLAAMAMVCLYYFFQNFQNFHFPIFFKNCYKKREII